MGDGDAPMMSWSGLVAALQRRYWRSRPRIRHRRAQPAPTPVLRIHGPTWFRDLFAPEFTLATSDDDHTTDLTIVSAEDQADGEGPIPQDHFVVSTPFIQPVTANPSRPRHRDDATLPDDFAQLTRDARRPVNADWHPTRRRRSNDARLGAWLEATASAHARYRAAHLHTANDVVRAAERARGLDTPQQPHEVTVVCATRRPHELENALANFARQAYPNRRLVLVTNSSQFDLDEVRRRIASIDSASTIDIDEDASLGTCLNAALAMTQSRFIAKFDDDDRYGAHYLTDMMIAHRFALAGVVGKHSHFATFTSDDRTYLRFPGHEFEDTSWVAGGTIVIDRDKLGDQSFEDRSIGEDAASLHECLRSGHAIYAADRFNYIQFRGDDNTWSQERSQYLRYSREAPSTNAVEAAEL